MKRKTWHTGAIVSIAMLAGCDRKTESSDQNTADTGLAPRMVEETTVTAMEVVAADAGPDATPMMVGVAVTTLTTKGNPAVVERIATARCEREQRCKNVGADRKFATLEDCRGKIAADWAEDLNQFDCPGGYDQKELDECLAKIRDEDCMRPFETLARIVACRSSDICKH